VPASTSFKDDRQKRPFHREKKWVALGEKTTHFLPTKSPFRTLSKMKPNEEKTPLRDWNDKKGLGFPVDIYRQKKILFNKPSTNGCE
jgi:hypothetical protein